MEIATSVQQDAQEFYKGDYLVEGLILSSLSVFVSFLEEKFEKHAKVDTVTIVSLIVRVKPIILSQDYIEGCQSILQLAGNAVRWPPP